MALFRTGGGSINFPLFKGFVYAVRRGVQRVAITNNSAAFSFESSTQQSGTFAFMNDYSTLNITASGSSNYQVTGIKDGVITNIGSYVNQASYSNIDISGYDMILIDGMVLDSITSVSFTFA